MRAGSVASVGCPFPFRSTGAVKSPIKKTRPKCHPLAGCPRGTTGGWSRRNVLLPLLRRRLGRQAARKRENNICQHMKFICPFSFSDTSTPFPTAFCTILVHFRAFGTFFSFSVSFPDTAASETKKEKQATKTTTRAILLFAGGEWFLLLLLYEHPTPRLHQTLSSSAFYGYTKRPRDACV